MQTKHDFHVKLKFESCSLEKIVPKQEPANGRELNPSVDPALVKYSNQTVIFDAHGKWHMRPAQCIAIYLMCYIIVTYF